MNDEDSDEDGPRNRGGNHHTEKQGKRTEPVELQSHAHPVWGTRADKDVHKGAAIGGRTAGTRA